jgi:hypothetical protein
MDNTTHINRNSTHFQHLHRCNLTDQGEKHGEPAVIAFIVVAAAGHGNHG